MKYPHTGTIYGTGSSLQTTYYLHHSILDINILGKAIGARSLYSTIENPLSNR